MERNCESVVIGTPIYRSGAYILDKFLENQKQIQEDYSSSELVLAASEQDFIKELEEHINSWKLKGRVLFYRVVKPSYAKSEIWNISCGREAIRKHVLSQAEAKYVIFLDADMTFETSVIKVMKREIEGYDVVFSGYPLRNYGIGLAGAGCVMFTRNTLEKIRFRCHEFKSGGVMFEDNLLELDLYRLGARVKKGFFISINHYINPTEARRITPRPVGIICRAANLSFIRYILLSLSIALHLNIPWKTKVLFNRLMALKRKIITS